MFDRGIFREFRKWNKSQPKVSRDPLFTTSDMSWLTDDDDETIPGVLASVFCLLAVAVFIVGLSIFLGRVFQ